jgi:hypothetical protein
MIEQAADLGLVAGRLELANGVVIPVVFQVQFRQAFVPQIATVEREVDGVLRAPQQPARQAVAQRDRLVPCLDRSLKLQPERLNRGMISRHCGDRQRNAQQARYEAGG